MRYRNSGVEPTEPVQRDRDDDDDLYEAVTDVTDYRDVALDRYRERLKDAMEAESYD